MILVCPSCSTTYLTEVQFPPEGRKVRCAKCSHVWRAMPDDDATPAEEVAPAAPVAEQPSADQQPPEPPEAAEAKRDEDEPPAEHAEAQPDEGEPPAEDADAQPDEDHQEVAADADARTDEEPPQPAEAQPEESAAPDEQPDEGEPPSEAAADVEEDDGDDDDIVFNEPEAARAAPEAEPETDDMSASEDEAVPEDEAAPDETVADDEDEISAEADADADAEWTVDEEPDAAQTDVATAEVEHGDTGLPVSPGAVAVTPTGPVVDATAEEVFVASDHGPKRRGVSSLTMAWVALILVIGVASVAAYIFRFDIVRSVPAVAQVYRAVGIPVNARGLEIRDLAYSWEVESTRAVLVVQGQVVNITSKPLEVPQLVLALRDQELANLREVPADVGLRAPLQPGAEAQFRVRILAPPETTSNVFVRFAEAR